MKSNILLINLDKSTERYEQSRAQLVSQQLAFERISAVYGKALSANDVEQAYDVGARDYYKSLNVGEIGCYLSHRKAWQKIIDDQLDFAVILEDDVTLHDNLSQAVACIEAIETPWHYIKLSGHSRIRSSIYSQSCGDFNLVHYQKVPARTCAQAVSREGAKRLLASSQPFSRPVDIDLQYWWEKDIEVQGMLPYPCSPNLEVSSDIVKQADKTPLARKSLWRKWLGQCQFILRNRIENQRLLQRLRTKTPQRG